MCDLLYRLQLSNLISTPAYNLVLGHLLADTSSAPAGEVDLASSGPTEGRALSGRGGDTVTGGRARAGRVGGRVGEAGGTGGGNVGSREGGAVDGGAGRRLGGGRGGDVAVGGLLDLLGTGEKGAEDGGVDLACSLECQLDQSLDRAGE